VGAAAIRFVHLTAIPTRVVGVPTFTSSMLINHLPIINKQDVVTLRMFNARSGHTPSTTPRLRMFESSGHYALVVLREWSITCSKYYRFLLKIELAESGTKHVQGFICSERRVRLSTVKKWLGSVEPGTTGRAHVEAIFEASTPAQAAAYCKDPAKRHPDYHGFLFEKGTSYS